MNPRTDELGERDSELRRLVEELLRLLRRDQSPAATPAGCDCDLQICLLEQIARITCLNANESHRMAQSLSAIQRATDALLDLYSSVHPEQALQASKLAKVRAQLEKCCAREEEPEPPHQMQPCKPHRGFVVGDGYSAKSRARVTPVNVPEKHKPWKIHREVPHEHEALPLVPQGPLVGPIVPAAPTIRPLDFRSGGGPSPSGGQEAVTFRTFTPSGIVTGLWPPDTTGAKAGDVVLMSGNLWFKLSLDGGKTFTDIDFTTVFAAEGTYGSWGSDPVLTYVPQIDCFVFYVQSSAGAEGTANQSKSVVKVALASPSDLKKSAGGKAAWWRQWHFTSDDFGLGAWMDFPGISFGDAFLYVNTNTYTRNYPSPGKKQDAYAGKLFFELPLKELQAGSGFSFYYGLIADSNPGAPAQNIGDENYWAAHVNNSALRVYSSRGSDPNYFWRERPLLQNWPLAKTLDANGGNDVISSASDSADWISEDHRILGATKVANQIWFAWAAASGKTGAGGFDFPRAHVQIAKIDLTQDYKVVEQTQVWNADIAFAYPSLTTNSNNEVGISLAWGGGSAFGSHAVGILGDFVVWYGEASQRTSTQLSPTRFGDYMHVRLAYPDTRFFSAFGYAVLSDTSTVPATERDDYLYVEFGREAIPASPLH
jgi:hypothetical protein